MVKTTKILTNQRGKYTIILTKGRAEETFFLCGSAQGIGGAWCEVQRSTEAIAEPRKARPPAAGRNRHFNDTLPLPPGDAPKS